jgi:hypothetical protein
MASKLIEKPELLADNSPVLTYLKQLFLCECHQPVHFLRRLFVIIDSRRITGDAVYLAMKTYLQDLSFGGYLSDPT